MSETNRLALPDGTTVGSYTIAGFLGKGGFGITYLAEHTGLQRKAALKELLPLDLATRIENHTVVAQTQALEDDFQWARERFIDEARTLAKFQHPNIVAVHDIFEANGTAYMATAFEEGSDLEDLLRESSGISEQRILGILNPILDGLEAVHAENLLHRDIKPGNIYVCENGRPILLDFGSARQAINSRSRPITSIITPGYAPFEQYHEDGNQGPWSDIYALGAVVHRFITGEKPPDASKRVRNDPYVKLVESHKGQYSENFLQAVDWALMPFEDERPQTIQEWRDRLPSKPGASEPQPAPVATSEPEKPVTQTAATVPGRKRPKPAENPAPGKSTSTLRIEDRITLRGKDLDGDEYRILLKIADLAAKPDGFTVGRSRSESDLLLDNTSVSRTHARLTWNPQQNQVEIEDLDSGNGTWIEGRKLTGKQPLPLDLPIEIGEVTLNCETSRKKKKQPEPRNLNIPAGTPASAPKPATPAAATTRTPQDRPRLALATGLLLLVMTLGLWSSAVAILDVSRYGARNIGEMTGTVPIFIGLAVFVLSIVHRSKLAFLLCPVLIALPIFLFSNVPYYSYSSEYVRNREEFQLVGILGGIVLGIFSLIYIVWYLKTRQKAASAGTGVTTASRVLIWVSFATALISWAFFGSGMFSVLGFIAVCALGIATFILGVVGRRPAAWIAGAFQIYWFSLFFYFMAHMDADESVPLSFGLASVILLILAIINSVLGHKGHVGSIYHAQTPDGSLGETPATALIVIGYIISVLGGLIGIFIALHLLLSTKDGQKKYNRTGRTHGTIMLPIAIVSLIGWAVASNS